MVVSQTEVQQGRRGIVKHIRQKENEPADLWDGSAKSFPPSNPNCPEKGTSLLNFQSCASILCHPSILSHLNCLCLIGDAEQVRFIWKICDTNNRPALVKATSDRLQSVC